MTTGIAAESVDATSLDRDEANNLRKEMAMKSWTSPNLQRRRFL
jgi:hypothetical protein